MVLFRWSRAGLGLYGDRKGISGTVSFEMKLLSLEGDGIKWSSSELMESEVSYAGDGQG